MSSDGTNQVVPLVQAWIKASNSLGIEVIAPFTLRNKEKSTDCVAFLPHFGGTHGLVIGVAQPPNFETDPLLIELAREAGIFYSFINLETYAVYDEDRFKETLNDWGFWASPDLTDRGK